MFWLSSILTFVIFSCLGLGLARDFLPDPITLQLFKGPVKVNMAISFSCWWLLLLGPIFSIFYVKLFNSASFQYVKNSDSLNNFEITFGLLIIFIIAAISAIIGDLFLGFWSSILFSFIYLQFFLRDIDDSKSYGKFLWNKKSVFIWVFMHCTIGAIVGRIFIQFLI